MRDGIGRHVAVPAEAPSTGRSGLPGSLPQDTRGIVSPRHMMRRVRLTRYPPPAELTGLIDWFWSVEYALPDGLVHRQDVVSQPGVNLSVGVVPPEGADPPPGPYSLRFGVQGVSTALSTRMLSAAGWNLAAKSSTGGFGAWHPDVAALTDRWFPTAEVLALHRLGTTADEVAEAVAAGAVGDGVPILSDLLVQLVDHSDPHRVETAREVARVAAAVEHDRTVARVEHVAALAGVTVRTVQRLFSSYAGVSPTWVIRRFRLLEAAELVRGGQEVDWAEVASDLGYSDQAHLTRDFTATLGSSPAAYGRAQRLGHRGVDSQPGLQPDLSRNRTGPAVR
ncbi:MAG: helix-turn-helix domain-containing protein [Actinomycetales bacterium]